MPFIYVKRGSPKHQNYLLEGRHLVIQVFSTRWEFQEPICISVPAGTVVRGYVQLQWNFLTLSMHLPILWWVIYECTCPHHAEYSAVFDAKQHHPQGPAIPIHPISPQSTLFCFPGWEKFAKGNVLEEVKQKMADALKGIQINEFKNFWAVEKMSQYNTKMCIASNG